MWTTGTLARTTWQDSAVFGKPHATEYSEDGTDFLIVKESDILAIVS